MGGCCCGWTIQCLKVCSGRYVAPLRFRFNVPISDLGYWSGAVESLEKEVAPFGVNVHLAVLGQFRTEILAKRQKPERVPNPIAEYDALIESYQRRLERADGSQPGDPAQAVGRILDAVCRRGYFAEREAPLRIVLGSDALDVVRSQCNETLRDLERQEKMARSTDFPG